MESHVQLSQRAWVLLFAFSFLLAHELVHASDLDPLQDFCMASFSPNARRVDGYPCKLCLNVTTKDFAFIGLRSGLLAMVTCLIYEQLKSSCGFKYLISSS
jgi:hypothetical protein